MGIPAFAKWLFNKYPKVISSVIEDSPRNIDDEYIPIDYSDPNPNGEEFDNLYLDMNNIVHPCTHPEDRPAPDTEDEMMLEVFKYTERLVNMVRPRKLLMMAVDFSDGDGVAPRAKMNQQRSRRFRSVQEAKEDADAKAELWKLLISSGKAEPGSSPPTKDKFDSNVITPGTPFMDKLAQALRYWAAYKVNTEPGWANLKIVISDASVPGEGEHKIIEYIRSQRRSPDHDPNTRHVIYGLDADLIMLGLITHEPHFRILREDVFYQDSKPRRCHICNQTGHIADECTGEIKVKEGEFDEKEPAPEKKPYIWLHVAALREYLEIELHHPNSVGFKWDLERALDDYVFLCFFVGNDFLPHLPTLSIREEGIDLLIQVWKESLPLMGGYVTKDGTVDLKRAQYIFDGIAKREDKIFKDRREADLRREANNKRRKLEREARSGPNTAASGQRGRGGRRQRHEENADDVITFKPGEANSREVREMGQEIYLQRKEIFQAQVDNTTANKSAAAVLKEQLHRKKSADAPDEEKTADKLADEEAVMSTPSALGKRKADEMDEGNDTPGRTTPVPKGNGRPTDEMPPDDVRMWEEGYAERYYERKFHVDPKDIDFRHKVAAAYVEGLCWVALYYIQGCPSWTWYYPYHYAPFAKDFAKASSLELHFEKGKTFRPYEQLMGVLPAASNHAIPKPFRSLMEEEDSPIIDFYPEDFELDLNGKKFRWQGVALLPFINEKRLLDAMATKYPELTEDEVSRNQVGKDVMVISKKHPSYADILTNFYSKKQGEPIFKLNPKKSGGMTGQVEKVEDYLPDGPLVFPLEGDMPDFPEDQSMSVYYSRPTSTHPHKSQLLRGAVIPPRVLTDDEVAMQHHRVNNPRRGRGGYRGNNDRRSGGDSFRPRGGGGYPQPPHQQPNFQYGGVERGFPPGTAQVPPPPWMAAQMGFQPPPPPPGYGGGRGGGYGQPPPQQQPHRSQSYGSMAPPGGYQQQQQGYGGYNGQQQQQQYGSGGGYQGGQDYGGGHQGGQGGYGRGGGNRSASDGYNGWQGGGGNQGHRGGQGGGRGYDGRANDGRRDSGGRGGGYGRPRY